MGWHIVCCIMLIIAWLWLFVEGSEIYNKRDSLDSYFYYNSFTKIHNPRTGKLYDVSLPANFSGMEVSFVRFRARNLWKNGANHSLFAIPPLILPFPFAKRVDLVYQNLGNWSSYYYDVPNYTLVAPVIGFLAYEPNKSSINYGLVELKLMGTNPIIVHFPSILVSNLSMKCVQFDTNGTFEFSSVEAKSSCVVRSQGHFSVVVPYHQEKKDKIIKWWMIVGIVCGVVGLILIVVSVVVVCKWIRWKRIKKMERQTERSEGLDTIWIGRSRMPSATCIRTQPVPENSYLP